MFDSTWIISAQTVARQFAESGGNKTTSVDFLIASLFTVQVSFEAHNVGYTVY